ncbi:MAG: TolC family protein [Myxococcales bacterium]|nr:TolC family protein [Myxococcales bacterium]
MHTALALLLAATASGGRRQVSLHEALQLAAKQGPEVAAARAQAAIVHAGVDKAWTAWQPDLAVNGTYDHTNGTAAFDFGPILAKLGLDPNLFGPPITIVAQNNWYGNAQLTQPLLTPQGLFGPGAASAAAEAADRGADEAREQVLLGVARAYLGLQGLYGLLDAAHEAEKVALRREEDAKARIAAGTDVEIGLLRAQTETAQARSQIAALQGQLDALLPVLEALTGEAIEPQPFGETPEDLGTPAAETAQPWEQAYSVKSAVAAVIAAQRARRISEFSWMPTVAGIAKESYTSNEGFTGKNWTYDLMINVSVPLYDRGMRYAQGHEDEAKIAQAQAQLAAARARARSAWIGARANVAAAQAVLEQSNAQAQLAARAQTQVEVAARAGVATSLDLSDADQKKFAAQSAAAQARAQLEVRKAEVAAAEGRLYALSAK